MYRIGLPNPNKPQVVKVVFEDFDSELTETLGLEQQFTIEISEKVAESFVHDLTFAHLSSVTDVRLSCMGKVSVNKKD
ncbi:unnamed protein product [Enterobius vermicularis]|uniref:Fn3_like domain-containing protein n=1 Tax=Enterobius vermicularis TaxID=51028 RepID=A0A0N4UX14_ENTVE|nr:unnamed protein product [Enterobius vermicularis]